MNKGYIAGHLGEDPRDGVIPSGPAAGKGVIHFSVGVKCRRGGQDDVIWWNVTVWKDRAHLLGIVKALKKGSAVLITGEIGKPRTYVGKDGQTQIAPLELTAEGISFSPFGRGDSANNSNSQIGHEQHSSQGSQQPYENAYAFSQSPATSPKVPSFAEGIDSYGKEDDALPF